MSCYATWIQYRPYFLCSVVLIENVMNDEKYIKSCTLKKRCHRNESKYVREILLRCLKLFSNIIFPRVLKGHEVKIKMSTNNCLKAKKKC